MTRWRTMAVLAGGLAVRTALPALAEEPNPNPAPHQASPLAGAAAEPATSATGTAGQVMPMKLTEEQKDALIQSLSERLDEALRRLDKLEANQKEATPPAAAPTASRIPGTSGTFIPNISIIGNLIARGGDTRATPGRGRSHFEELEIAFQDAVAPNLRYDIHLAAEKEEEWTVALEEGYLTATALMKGLNARAGRIRTPFGKFNRLHPHSWPFITQPAAHTALVGEHGLISDGAVFEYLLPIRGLYANLEFGAWQTTGLHHEHEEEGGEHEEGGFVGGEHGAYSARLALAKSLGRDNELELGFSRYWGRGEVHDLGRRMLALNGVDLTFRRYGQGYKRWLFQTEFLAHETRGAFGETKFRPGAFATLAHRWSKFWEAGLRLDYTQFPYPIEGRTYGGSLFLTRFLTEQTSLRLEYRHANDREFGPGNSIFFQLLYGSGPHQHNLQ